MGHGQFAKANGNGRAAQVQQQPMLVQIPDAERAATYHCPNCMANAFQDNCARFVEISEIVSPTGKTEIGRQPVMRCLGCGNVWDLNQLKRLSAEERSAMLEELRRRQEEIQAQQMPQKQERYWEAEA
jgi:hypothetical protein